AAGTCCGTGCRSVPGTSCPPACWTRNWRRWRCLVQTSTDACSTSPTRPRSWLRWPPPGCAATAAEEQSHLRATEFGSGAPAGLLAADALLGDFRQVAGLREGAHRVGGQAAGAAPLGQRRPDVGVEGVHQDPVGTQHVT